MSNRTTAPPRPRRNRVLLAAGLAATVAATIVGTGAVMASAAPAVNLSQGKAITASSVENGDYTGAKLANDGDLGTRWSSQFSDAQWLQVDLGVNASLDHVVLNWEAAYGKAFTI